MPFAAVTGQGFVHPHNSPRFILVNRCPRKREKAPTEITPMFDDVHQYHVLRTSLAVAGLCTMPSNNKVTSTFVESVCYDSLGCCTQLVSDRSVGISLPPKSADQLDIASLSNAIATPTLARNLRRACKHIFLSLRPHHFFRLFTFCSDLAENLYNQNQRSCVFIS